MPTSRLPSPRSSTRRCGVPSAPIAKRSHLPEYEVRAATLVVAEQSAVQGWNRHVYADDTVDVVAIPG